MNIEETPIPFPDKPQVEIEEEINIPEDFFATSLEHSTKFTEQVSEEPKEEKHFRSYAEIFADLARLNFEEIESNKKIEKLLI